MKKSGSWKKNLILLWLSQLAVMSGFSAMIPFIPLFIKNRFGITDEGNIAYYVSYFNFFGTMAYAIFCPIWGVLSDRFGVKPMLLRGTFVTSWMFPLMAYVPGPGWLIFLRFLTAACAGSRAVVVIGAFRKDAAGALLEVLPVPVIGLVEHSPRTHHLPGDEAPPVWSRHPHLELRLERQLQPIGGSERGFMLLPSVIHI